jgi:hypothetical protein
MRTIGVCMWSRIDNLPKLLLTQTGDHTYVKNSKSRSIIVYDLFVSTIYVFVWLYGVLDCPQEPY